AQSVRFRRHWPARYRHLAMDRDGPGRWVTGVGPRGNGTGRTRRAVRVPGPRAASAGLCCLGDVVLGDLPATNGPGRAPGTARVGCRAEIFDDQSTAGAPRHDRRLGTTNRPQPGELPAAVCART